MTELYGDVEWHAEIAALAQPVLALAVPEQNLDSLRALLIASGQLEQMVNDLDGAPDWLRSVACSATDHAAAAFYTHWSEVNAPDILAGWTVQGELELARRDLSSLASVALHGRARVPEGFAFYGLFPDQYCAATVRYLRSRGASSARVQVIGVRSIGTALSAVVAAVLRAAGRPHHRHTVRPGGHPFARSVRLETPIAAADLALVVDEGPGLSGSSLYAVHQALGRAGVAEVRQVFFCGHGSGPGSMAQPIVRNFWCRAKRYAASVEEPSFSRSGSLRATLAAEVSAAFGSPVMEIQDCSSGSWRAHAYRQLADWPPSYSAFERPKWLALLSDGRSVLLKFYGQVLINGPNGVQSSDAVAVQSIAGASGEVLRMHGYVARLWRTGRLLCLADKDSRLIEALAAFLGSRSWRCLNPTLPAVDGYYGCSGQLAPQEWFFDAAGRLLKLPESVHGYDHTSIDAQPLGWDLAGAIVEWELRRTETEQLLGAFAAHSGLSATLGELTSYVRRYAQFCAAKAEFCATRALTTDARLLQLAARRYASRAQGHFDD